MNEDLDVSTHSERSPGHSLRRGIVGTNVRVSLRVKHCESAVRRNPKLERCVRTLVKINNNHTLERPSKVKKIIIVTFPIVASCASRGRRACKNFDERRRSGPGTQAVTAPGAFAFNPHENLNFGAIICLEFVTF